MLLDAQLLLFLQPEHLHVNRQHEDKNLNVREYVDKGLRELIDLEFVNWHRIVPHQHFSLIVLRQYFKRFVGNPVLDERETLGEVHLDQLPVNVFALVFVIP